MGQQKPLTLVRTAESDNPPAKTDIIEAARVCTRPESAFYLHDRVKSLYHNSKNIDPIAGDQILVILNSNAKELQAKEEHGKDVIWAGRPLSSSFERLKQYEAIGELKLLPDETLNVECQIAISNDSDIRRSYTSNSQLGKERVDGLDKLLGACLANHSMVIGDDGIIYQGKNGVINTDGKASLKAEYNDIIKALHDPEKGLAAYVQTHAKAVKLDVVETAFPAATPEEKISSKR